jgi:hypothetical protein
MARITIKGTIDKVFASRVGFSVMESSTNKTTGMEYKTWFNVFTTEIDGNNIGDSVTVEGFASAGAFMGKDKNGDPQPKGSISVNQCTITKQHLALVPPVDDDLF